MEWSEDLGGIRLRMSRDADSIEDLTVELDVRDRELLSKNPTLKIEFVTQRLESKWQGLVFKGKNRAKVTVFEGEIPVAVLRRGIELKKTPFYDFSGEEIESFCVAKLSCRGSLGEKRIPNPFPLPRSQTQGANEVTQPKDEVDPSANFAMLPTKTKIETRLVQVILALVGIGVLIWGISVEIWTWEKIGRAGDSIYPWFLWLCAFPFLYFVGWTITREALAKYISIDASNTTRFIPSPNQSYSLAEVLSGEAEVNIDNATFRVVCCNRERYRYLRRSSNGDRWLDRYHDFNGLVLYEHQVTRIPAGTKLSDCLPKTRELSFDGMFANLYPQAMVSKHYGISVYWEVQILHDQLVDIEIPVVGIDRDWPFRYFVQS